MTTEQTTTLATLRNNTQAETLPVSVSMDTVQGFEALQRIAKLFASSEIIPARFQQNMASCFIAVDMAMRLRANPISVMQSLYIVHGTPAWSAKFLIATFNKCGRFSAIRYAFQGKEGSDEWGCRALAKELATGEDIAGPLITIGLAKKEGWFQKTGSKWQTIPELMLRYRAAAWLVNTYAPEIAMGLQTVEDVQDTYELEPSGDGSYQVSLSDIRKPSELPPAKEPKQKAKTGTKPETADVSPDAGIAQEHQVENQDDTPPSGMMYPKFCPDKAVWVEEDDCQTCTMYEGCPAWVDS